MWPWVRLSWWAIAAVIGVVGADRLAAPAWAWLVLAALAALARPAPRTARLMVIVAALAAAWTAIRSPVAAPPPGVIVDDRDVDVLDGVVVGPLTALAGATGAIVEVGDAAVWVTIDGPPRAWPGDRVRVVGRLFRPRGYRNPGGVDRAAVARNRGADYELHALGLTVVEAAARWSPWRAPARLAARLSTRIADAGGDPVGNALVRAIVVGDRSALDDGTDDAWRAAGVYHALSVSGLHLAVVALFAFAALTWLFAWIPAIGGRIAPRRLAALVSLPLAIGYTLVTGGQVATVRALVVVAVMLVGAWSDRRAAITDALGLAALIAIGDRPSVVFDPSFQLSFAAALTLVVAGRGRAPTIGRWWRRAAAAIGGAIRTSWIVTLTTAPITAWHFGQVSLGGVVGNLIVGPALELCALPIAVVGAITPGLGGPLLDLAIAVAGLTARAIAALAPLTPTLEVRAPTGLELAAALALALAWAAARYGARRWPLALAVIAAVALCGSWYAHRGHRHPTLTVTFLDVGQGDAAVIEFPDGAVWLVDAGGAPGAGPVAAQLAPGRAVVAVLRARGIRRIDVAIVSHPHPDHYLGLLAVAAAVPIGELWDAADGEPPTLDGVRDGDPAAPRGGARSYQAVAEALVVAGTRRIHPALGVHRQGDVVVEVLAPRYDGRAEATTDPVASVNDNSLVVRIGRGASSVLLLGDVEAEGEEALVAAGLGAATVVKAPHHGSPTSSSPALIAATRPRWVVMSLGRANRFRFPSPAVVARWRAADATVLRTDLHGAVTVTLDRRGGVGVSTFDAPADETWAGPRVIMPR